MSKILPSEIDVNKLAIRGADRVRVARTLWRPGDFKPHEDLAFVKKFISIKDPVEVARRARAYVAMVSKTHLDDSPTTYTPEYAIIANQLFAVGFSAQQVHDISKTKANVAVLDCDDTLKPFSGGMYD